MKQKKRKCNQGPKAVGGRNTWEGRTRLVASQGGEKLSKEVGGGERRLRNLYHQSTQIRDGHVKKGEKAKTLGDLEGAEERPGQKSTNREYIEKNAA